MGVVDVEYFGLDVDGVEYDIMDSILPLKQEVNIRVSSIENT